MHHHKRPRIVKKVYSTDVEGDVQEAEICIFSINNDCDLIVCPKLHAKCQKQWQFKVGVNWYNFRNFHSKELEAAFIHPEIDSIKLSKIDPKKLDERHVRIANLLTTEELTANFESERVESDNIKYEIRRLSTCSSVISENALATVWDWYFEDEQGKWIKYGQVNSLNKRDCVPRITSKDIEEKFLRSEMNPFNFSSAAGHKYDIYFVQMVQVNRVTHKVRKIKRRPHFTSPSFDSKFFADIPKHWTRMNRHQISEQINLKEDDREYKEIEKLVTESLSVRWFQSIKRNQNPSLWRSFLNGKNIMMLKHKVSESDLNEMKLFHGTSKENIEAILNRNLDWRLHGKRSGQTYGRGTYFAKQASYSDKYADFKDQHFKYLLVCRVLVGRYTVGEKGMRTPPMDPSSRCMFDSTVDKVENPSIFVKYDTQEYYPEYLVTYRT